MTLSLITDSIWQAARTLARRYQKSNVKNGIQCKCGFFFDNEGNKMTIFINSIRDITIVGYNTTGCCYASRGFVCDS